MKKLFVTLLAALFILGMATSAMAATSGSAIPAVGDYQGDNNYAPAPPVDGDVYDNNIGNANDTGLNVGDDTGAKVGDVIKSEGMTFNGGTVTGTQRTHGEYQNNTNSCASCHQTHTAAAKDLLFKQGVYNTCTACHDGTLGFYDVFEASTAGTFGGTAEGNASIHMVKGTLNIAWAPGGDDSKDASVTGNDTGKAWTGTFDCAACHAPHGSYSDRLLHYNPNNMGAVNAAGGGLKLENLAVVDAAYVASATTPDFYVLRTTASAAGITTEVATEPVLVVMAKSKKTVDGVDVYSYARSKTPWLYGYDTGYAPDGSRIELHWTTFQTADGTRLEEVSIDRELGLAYAKGAGVTDAVIANIARAYVVKLGGTVTIKIDGVDTAVDLNMQEIADFGGVKITKVNTGIYDEKGYGVAIGTYCAACHTDYRAKSGSSTGMFSGAFRHTTNNDSYTCLKCHFAHGTDVTVMADGKDNTVASLVAGGMDAQVAEDYIIDKNPSSALKRYTNMSVCWKCHTGSKAGQLKNNDYFWNNEDAPHGGTGNDPLLVGSGW